MDQIRPIETDTTTVPKNATGEDLGRILWRGRQWAVTEYGLEALDGVYQIEASRLDDEISSWSWLRRAWTKELDSGIVKLG